MVVHQRFLVTRCTYLSMLSEIVFKEIEMEEIDMVDKRVKKKYLSLN